MAVVSVGADDEQQDELDGEEDARDVEELGLHYKGSVGDVTL